MKIVVEDRCCDICNTFDNVHTYHMVGMQYLDAEDNPLDEPTPQEVEIELCPACVRKISNLKLYMCNVEVGDNETV